MAVPPVDPALSDPVKDDASIPLVVAVDTTTGLQVRCRTRALGRSTHTSHAASSTSPSVARLCAALCRALGWLRPRLFALPIARSMTHSLANSPTDPPPPRLQGALAGVQAPAPNAGPRSFVVMLRGPLDLAPNASAGWPPPGGQAVAYPVLLLGEGTRAAVRAFSAGRGGARTFGFSVVTGREKPGACWEARDARGPLLW
jgi:hypothetical protein